MAVVPMFLRQFRRLLQIKRLLQMLFVCYSLLNSQNMSVNNSERLDPYLPGHLRHSEKSCRLCTEKGAITEPWRVLSTIEVR